MAIDTLKLQVPGPSPTEAFADWLRERFGSVRENVQLHDNAEKPWLGLQWDDPSLGAMGLKANRRGCWLWVERSLPKMMHGENCRVISAAEAIEAVRLLRDGMIGTFAQWSPWTPENMLEGCKVQRLDLCYQQQVPCSSEVFNGLAGCIKARRIVKHQWVGLPLQAELFGGLTLHQSRFELARWYDKGMESGDERYVNVVRHEEQLRGGKAGFLLDASQSEPVFRLDQARERMNARYGDAGAVQGHGLGALLQEHGNAGVAAALLVVAPEYETLCRRYLSNGSYYRLRNLALEARRHQFNVDLRLPVEAWAEPMVL